MEEKRVLQEPRNFQKFCLHPLCVLAARKFTAETQRTPSEDWMMSKNKHPQGFRKIREIGSDGRKDVSTA
jgi:hypothetical protein